MNKDKEIYELDQNGNITGYNVNLDTERFSFLSKDHSMYRQMLGKVNSLLNGMVAERDYEIDWESVVAEYMARGIGDVPHFANQYVVNNYRLRGREMSPEVLEAIYLEIVASINGEIGKGTLPATKEDLEKLKG